MADAPLIQPFPSPNFNERREASQPTMLVMHYTGMQSATAALTRLCTPDADVSAHYLIEEDGRIYQMVADHKRAWHAGVGNWRGITDINSASIGIEIVNPGHEFGYRPFPEPQMASVLWLSRKIVQQYDIEPFNVIGHSDLAPVRKVDPGELFNWRMLAENGVGIWPIDYADDPGDETMFLENLKFIGYDVTDPEMVTAAFQRHWRQTEISGKIDMETRVLAATLRKQVAHLTK
ncbi:MAG: N-acetylmuramoyl-L-alanine amidase [Sneathiella sp.]|nr:N-acetylmuramoyl-L-alanine amidase [Sneathiella sp.]